MSNSSELSISVLLIFKMQLMNEPLFLRANVLSYTALFRSVTLIVLLTAVYASI